MGDLSTFIVRRNTLGSHPYTRDMMSKYPNPTGGALNEVIVRHFLKQLASSLKFLRDRNLIHRDIKPQNLLLCPPPASYRAGVAQVIPYKGSDDSYDPVTGLQSLPMLKIADFGFARSLPSTSLAETLCGSPLYMAPEILRYEKYDAKADLWSVGAVLHEMVVGKPPFRAGNHVDLLRKIERGMDRIKFSEDNPVSSEIKSLIRVLLKRNPVERMSFRDFFQSSVVQDEIPGLVADDLPAEQRRSSSSAAIQGEPARLPSRQSSRVSRTEQQQQQQQPQDPERREDTQSAADRRLVGGGGASSRPATAMHRMGSVDRSPAAREARRTSINSQRPAPVPHGSIAPGRQELLSDRGAVAVPASERQRYQNAMAAMPTEKQNANDVRERAMQDVAFERDYVLVEKRAVEVNAFADELAHSPRFQTTLQRPGQVGVRGRPSSTQNAPTTTTPPSPPSTAAKAMQIVPGRPRPDSAQHYRQNSYERRYGHSPTSTTSAISKALNMASGRLFGVGFSPPMNIAKGGRSPPLAYNPFPAYPVQGYLLPRDDRTSVPADEDRRVVQIIEDCAARGDAVYGLAEVKYSQLVPLAPSEVSPVKPDRDGSNPSDAGLTVYAIVATSEEALVLYVKTLALLAKSMDIAGSWWARKNGGELLGELNVRVNDVVQWVRNRFNEVLEKAEFVRLKLLDAQKRLSPDSKGDSSDQAVASAGSGDVVVSDGVSAEKLMYDRAIDLSRLAAIKEIAGDELWYCEGMYLTAVRMLEAVLEDDEVPKQGGDKSNPKEDEKQAEYRKAVAKGMRRSVPSIIGVDVH